MEHEQEALFNTLGKRMDALEAEKRRLQTKLDETDASRASLAGGESDPNVTKSGLTASTTAASIDAPSSTSSGVDLAEPSPLVSRSSINIGGVRDRPSTSMTSLEYVLRIQKFICTRGCNHCLSAPVLAPRRAPAVSARHRGRGLTARQSEVRLCEAKAAISV